MCVPPFQCSHLLRIVLWEGRLEKHSDMRDFAYVKRSPWHNALCPQNVWSSIFFFLMFSVPFVFYVLLVQLYEVFSSRVLFVVHYFVLQEAKPCKGADEKGIALWWAFVPCTFATYGNNIYSKTLFLLKIATNTNKMEWNSKYLSSKCALDYFQFKQTSLPITLKHALKTWNAATSKRTDLTIPNGELQE